MEPESTANEECCSCNTVIEYKNPPHSRLEIAVLSSQFMHIPDRDRCNWLRERIETPEEVSRLPQIFNQHQRLQFSVIEIRYLSSWPFATIACKAFHAAQGD